MIPLGLVSSLPDPTQVILREGEGVTLRFGPPEQHEHAPLTTEEAGEMTMRFKHVALVAIFVGFLGGLLAPPIHSVMYLHNGGVLWDSRDPFDLGWDTKR